MTTQHGEIHARLSEELGSFIQSRSSTFTCGGQIPITTLDEAPPQKRIKDTLSSYSGPKLTPFSLRWDSPSTNGGIAKLNIPIDAANEDQNAALQKLVADCQPASFGYQGQDIIDESYRKATKMDRSAFSVDFCPYELGIVDTIAQVLLPNADHRVGTQGVRAELYKLNIYAAPSGFFKAHVDTPRSDTQFGSLVVSLPCHHEGGQLVVRHAGRPVTFDWSTSNGNANSSIQWAAFYSDCEHEVLEVTEGHRITLTYNLYYSPGVGDLAGNSPAMDVRSLPLYHVIQEALAEPSFMMEGGYLGIYCQHAYAHSTPEGAKSLPGVLKGSDMAVYSVFLALGLGISVRPQLEVRYDHDERELYRLEEEYVIEGEDEAREIRERNAAMAQYERDCRELRYLGSELHPTVVSEVGGCGVDSTSEILEAFPGDWMRVNWLTEGPDVERNMNVGFVHMKYGNQAGLDHHYTSAVLIVNVPPAATRLAPAGRTVAFPE